MPVRVWQEAIRTAGITAKDTMHDDDGRSHFSEERFVKVLSQLPNMHATIDQLRALAKNGGLLDELMQLEEEADAKADEADELRLELKQLKLAVEEAKKALQGKSEEVEALEDEKSELRIELGELKIKEIELAKQLLRVLSGDQLKEARVVRLKKVGESSLELRRAWLRPVCDARVQLITGRFVLCGDVRKAEPVRDALHLR